MSDSSDSAPSASKQMQAWRLRWISDPVLKLFRRVTPSMSQTEREALDAGTVWWDGELFSGKPHWRKLKKIPAPGLSQEEQDFLNGPTETLCEMLDDWQITHESNDLPADVWAFIKDNGFFSMIIPKTSGGLEFSALAHSEVVMKISTRSISAAVTVMVPNSLGPAKLLMEYGTDEQREHYLPRLAKGVDVPCFALTSPVAGSDAGGIPDYGIVCRQDFQGQKDVLGMRLTWNKRYITLGPVATLLGLAFKLYDPEHLIGDKEDRGITLALIPTDTPGVNIGRRHMPLNIVFMNGPNSGDDVFVPLDWIIGGPDRVGQGWRMLMESLSDGRAISLPALSVGAAKLSSRAIGAYARVRRQFKMPIGRFEGVQEALARIGGYTYMMDAARVMTLNALDNGEKPSVISAIVKYHLTEQMRKIVNDSMDILGGAGICLGPRNIMGRAYQALPISITVEGANILTRSMIIFGQGAIRSHPYVFAELEAVAETDYKVSLEKFDRALFGHMFYFIRNFIRTFYLALTGARLRFVTGKRPVRRYYQKLSRLSSAFALLTDTALMTLGGSLKRKESISGRLGDMLSYLYLASATCRRFELDNYPKEDIPMLRWSCEYCLFHIQQAMDEMLNNLPNRPIAWMLRWVIFPWGRRFRLPNDRLSSEISEFLMMPSSGRDRLTKGIYLPTATDQQVGRLEDALTKVIQAEHVERKLRKSLKDYSIGIEGIEGMIKAGLEKDIINENDAKLLRQAEAARLDAIQVDDFDPNFGKEK